MATWSASDTMLGIVGLNARVVLNPLVVLDQLGRDAIRQVSGHVIKDPRLQMTDQGTARCLDPLPRNPFWLRHDQLTRSGEGTRTGCVQPDLSSLSYPRPRRAKRGHREGRPTPGVQPQNPFVPTPGFGNPIAPPQSLAPTPDVCSASSQSVRVCNNDFQSCSSACTAALLSDTTADITGCTLRCCTGFNACLSIRGCATGTVNCF
jgi:hypothetical protein